MTSNNLHQTAPHRHHFFTGVDPTAILLYVAIVVVGCICITSASFDEASNNYFDFSHFYIKQIVWVAVSFVTALFVLLVDVNTFHKLSYPLYFFGIILLILTLLFGREVNGAKSWFEFGSFRLQPVEIVKITTSIAMSRVMSEYSFSISKSNSLLRVVGVIALPLSIIVLQNDTGSGIVFCSFLFVLYREGLNKWLCLPVVLIATLFIASFVISPFILLITTLLIAIIFDALWQQEFKMHIIYFAAIMLSTIALKLLSRLLLGESWDSYTTLLCVTTLSTIPIILYSLKRYDFRSLIVMGAFLLCSAFVKLSDFIFNSILRPHQQGRIMSFLGIINDPLGKDYNVNQAKIAIGSGGIWGKGFLDGTQIKYGFVPERHTDFIFCDLAEEWGFIGSFVLLTLFMLLIFKLLAMGERQKESFGRVYCYCVASILLFHIFVNVGMTIGLMPVMGIPLPLMSYGGSSLLAFTTMLFIAFRLDSANIR